MTAWTEAGKATCKTSVQKSPETESPISESRWAQGPFHGAYKQLHCSDNSGPSLPPFKLCIAIILVV